MQVYSPPTSTHVTALFELPGLKNSDINVNVTRDGKLTVSGERRAPDGLAEMERRGELYPVQEFKYGRFERSINIPLGIEVRIIIQQHVPSLHCCMRQRPVRSER